LGLLFVPWKSTAVQLALLGVIPSNHHNEIRLLVSIAPGDLARTKFTTAQQNNLFPTDDLEEPLRHLLQEKPKLST
jgi:hypothetical protein